LTALFLALTITATSFAQDRKKITHKWQNTYPMISEVFYVQKADRTKKDGPYQMLREGRLLVSGYYNNDQKDSVWEMYGSNSILISRKWYHQGEKTGKWEFFTRTGEPDWTYDFNTQTLTHLRSPRVDTATFYYLTDTGDWVRDRLDRGPTGLFSQQEYASYMNRSFRYPVEAFRANQQGKVIISITVDEKGNAADYTVSQHASPALDEEALRVVKGFSQEFLPAKKDGKTVKTLYLSPVVFKLGPRP
jgi:TonB family protein